MSSFAEQRTAFQVLEDAIVKHRVLTGIAALEEKYGPDWADQIDLDNLDLSQSSQCVLGQLYESAEVSDEQASDFAEAVYNEQFMADRDYLIRNLIEGDGYKRGLAILDGSVTGERDGPARHGFEMGSIWFDDLLQMSDEQLIEIGATREMVDAARPEIEEYGKSLSADYPQLQPVWEEEIAQRRVGR